jgi:hypothetical protein
MPSSIMRSTLTVLAVGILASSCVPAARTIPSSSEDPPTAGEISEWRSKQQLAVATDEEISSAKLGEGPFSNNKAASRDRKLKVVFYPPGNSS